MRCPISTSVNYNFVFLGIILLASNGTCLNYDVLDTLDINDVFPKLPNYYKANENQTALYNKNSLDMSKVSDSHINITLQRLQGVFENITGYNISATENYDEIVMNDTKLEIINSVRRRLPRKTRRQGRQSLPWHGGDLYWDIAAEWVANQKMLDGMLTMIYMARHHVKTMAVQQVSAPKDDSYRLAYIWTKAQILHDRVIAIYNTMADNAYTYDWNKEWDRTFYFLMLHQKALKIHTQFNFYFWIIAKIHHKYSVINQLYQTTPTTLARRTTK